MFDFLFEGRLSVFLLFLLVLVFLFLMWRQRKDRGYLTGMGVVVVLAALYFLLDLVHETDKEAATRTLHELIAHVNKREHDKSFAFLADDFKAYGLNKETIRPEWEKGLRDGDVRNIRAKRIEVEKQDRDNHNLTLRFDAKADTNLPYNMVPCEVDFARDSQGRWRIKSFRLYDVIQSATVLNPFQR